MRKFMVLMVAAASALGACGGGSDSPAEQCRQGEQTLCNRYYECYSADEIMAAGLPAAKSDCVAFIDGASDQKCADATAANQCDTGETFHAGKADDCISELDDATCAEFTDGEQQTYAPSCNQICTTN